MTPPSRTLSRPRTLTLRSSMRVSIWPLLMPASTFRALPPNRTRILANRLFRNSRTFYPPIRIISVPLTASVLSCSRWPARPTIPSCSRNPRPTLFPYDPKLFEESKTYHQKHIQLKPEDPEPYYWIGVIDWTLAFRANGEARKEYNEKNIRKQVKDTDPLPPAIRGEYASKYGSLIDEGIGELQKAISIKPDYDDAMAYLNLLYRRKADMVASTDERNQLLKQADDLVDKVKEIKQKRAEQPQPSA